MKNRLTLLLALFFCTGWAHRLTAQGITVEPGTYFTISGSANVTVAGNLSSSGTVANAGTLNVSGNWSNTGTATVAGTVNLSSDNLTVSGQTVFANANLDDSSGAQQVVTDANAGSTPSDFGNLTVSGTNGASLGSNLYASQSLTLGSQLLTTNAYNMELGTGATTSNTTGYVLGNLQKAFNTGAQNFNFIVGTANGYSPATVAFNNITSAGKLTVNATQTYEPSAPVPSQALNRYWTLAAANGLAFDHFNITLNYLSVDFNGSPFVQATMESTMRGAAFDPTLNYPTVGTRVADDGSTGSIQLLNITNVGDFTTVTPCLSCGNTWLGNNTNWSDNTNWSSGTAPASCADNVTIPSGTAHDPVISSAASVGNISLTEGGAAATLTIQVNGALSVCGNINAGSGLSATFDGSSMVQLTGTVAQTLGGKMAFGTLVLDNTSGGVSLANDASVSIAGSLVLQNGNINTNSNNGATLTFTSTSLTQSAIIDNFSVAAGEGLGTITGTITAQRFYSTAALFGQHMIGSPVSGITGGSLGSANQSGAYITPTTDCDELHSADGTAYGNVFSYHESNGASCPMAEWYVEPSNASPVPGQGYSVVLTHPGSTFSLTGTANLTGSYEVAGLTNSNWTKGTLQRPGNSYISGWSLVSNPYLAPLNATGVASDNSASFDDGILVWDNSTGAYVDVTTVAPYTIAPFQAFLVHRSVTDLTGATYTIDGSNRVVTTATFSRQQNPEVLKLTASNTTTGMTDEATVGFNTNASETFNPALDFHKVPNDLSRHSLYTLKNDLWMLRNYSPSINQTATIQVGLEPGVSGNYTFGFDGINSFDPTSYITLEDTKLNVMYDVRNGNYNFTADAINDSWNRFVLHFTPPAVINATDATCDAPGMINIQQPGSANWNYTIADASNAILSSGVLNNNSPLSVNVVAGVYTLTLTDNTGYAVVKNIQVNGAEQVTASFIASAKIVEQNQDIAFTGTADNSSTFDWSFGDGASGTGAAVMHSYQSAGIYTITLNVVNASGCTSQSTQNVSVTPRSSTGIPTLNSNEQISIWSNTNLLYVDFTQMDAVEATIDVYNVLGQKLYSDRYNTSTVYMKEITDIEVGYIIVRVKNNDEIITKKVFITNDK